MKVCLVAHGYPPELVGGTEKSLHGLAHALAAQGVEVVVVAGTLECAEGFRTSHSMDGAISVHRLHRADPYFDHWQKSDSVWATDRFREILRDEKPDVVHVHHWIRVSRDLVHAAALQGVPAVVTLHDYWTTCLVAFRVRPDTKEFCSVKLGPEPCLACAGLVPPRTPWRSNSEQASALGEHRADLIRELELARAVLVPCASHARAVQSFLGIEPERMRVRVVRPGRELNLLPRSIPPAGDQLVLGAWGHLHPIKGQDLIIEAMHRMQHKDQIALRLAGGEPAADFAAQVRRSAEGLDVQFLGPFVAEELGEHAVSDVHAMVSGTRADESWGLILDEAAALGLPMILPQAGAFAERMQEGRGALFYAARDAGSLAELLDSLVQDRARLGAVRRAMPALEKIAPGVDAHVREVQALYVEAIELGAPPVSEADSPSGPERAAKLAAWDTGLGASGPGELGFPKGDSGA